jgi:hypothetical protein
MMTGETDDAPENQKIRGMKAQILVTEDATRDGCAACTLV